MKNLKYKLVLLGESAVGKSSIVLCLDKGQFQENSESTIGAAFLPQYFFINNEEVKIEIWDTAGQERYHSLAPMYYRGAQAAVVVYDVTNRDSFNRARNWIRELNDKTNWLSVTVIVGNKIDLEASRVVSYEEGKLFADEEKLYFFETSAKTNSNITETFQEIALHRDHKETSPVFLNVRKQQFFHFILEETIWSPIFRHPPNSTALSV